MRPASLINTAPYLDNTALVPTDIKEQLDANATRALGRTLRLLDCAKEGIRIQPICTDDLDHQVLEFNRTVQAGQLMPLPSAKGLNADWTPTVNRSHFEDASFVLSDANRALLNEVLYREDMLLYRHFCGPNQ